MDAQSGRVLRLRPLRRWWLPLASLGLNACQSSGDATAYSYSPAVRATAPIFKDVCLSVPGYQAFRSKLESIVETRDGAALRALFDSAGAMRVNGIGGGPGNEDWGFSRPNVESVWPELEAILKFGCVAQGDRLILPAMAALIDDPAVSTDHYVAIKAVDLKAAPKEASATIRRIAPGELVLVVYPGEPDGWSRLLVDGAEVFARSGSLRSPYSFQLVLYRFHGEWRIREFTSGV